MDQITNHWELEEALFREREQLRAEIERLRHDLAQARGEIGDDAEENERLRATLKLESEYRRNAVAEATRLRAALTKIQFLEASDADTWIWQAQEEAREALSADEQTPP